MLSKHNPRIEPDFQKLIEYSQDHISLVDAQSKILYANPSIEHMLGYTVEEYIGLSAMDLVHPDDLPHAQAVLQKLLTMPGLTEKVEMRIRHKQGHYVWLEAAVTNLLHDPSIAAMVSNSRDITERKQAQEKLRQNELRFQRTFDQAAVGISHLALDGRWLWVNQRLCDIVGYTAEEMLTKSFQDITHPDDLPAGLRATKEMLAGTMQTYSTHKRYIHQTGRLVWVKLSLTLVRNEQGEPDYFVSVVEDITSLKQAQQLLTESEERYRHIVEDQTDLICRYQADLTITFTNSVYSGLFSKVSEEMEGRNILEFVPPNQRDKVRSHIWSLTPDHPIATSENQLILADGSSRWFHWTDRMVVDEAGQVVEYQGVGRDITERKRLEETAQEQRRFAEVLRDALALLTTSLDTDQILGQILEYAEAVVPYDAATITLFEGDKGRIAYARGFSAEAETFFKDYHFSIDNPQYQKAITHRQPYLITDTQQYPDWVVIPATSWIRATIGIPIELRGNVIGLLAVDSATPNRLQQEDVDKLLTFARYVSLALENADHVTRLEQKVTERTAELNASKERLEAILNNSLDGIILANADLRIRQVNAAFTNMFGCDVASCFNAPMLNMIAPEDKAQVEAVIQSVLKDQVGKRVEARARRKDGTTFVAQFGFAAIRAESQEVTSLVCVVQDITERNQAQNALAEERNLLRTLIDTTPDFIYIKDTQHRFVLSNLALAKARGATSPEELVGKTDFDFFPADLAAQFKAEEVELFQTGKPLIDHEQPSMGWQGGFSWASSNKVPLYNLNGDLIGLVGITRDLTERKSRERQLRYHAALQENVSDAVIATDLELKVQSWNKAAEEIYGWTAEEVRGKFIGDVLQAQYESPDERERYRQEFLEQGEWHGEIRQRRKDGSDIYIYGSVDLFEDENGQPIGIVAVNHDITAHKLAERALSIKREEERQFQLHLKALQSITIELAQLDDLDTFYKRVVELGLEYLGFERLGLLLYDEQQHIALGTYGTDREGKPRPESHIRFDPAVRTGLLQRTLKHPERLVFDDNAEIYSDDEIIATGWKAAALLWNGTKSLGWLTTDNAVYHNPISRPQLDILALYSLTVGTLLAQKQTQAALRESEEKFRLLVEHAPEAIIISNQFGKITIVNAEAERVFGYDRDELLGQSIEILVPEKQRTAHENHRTDFVADPYVRVHGEVNGLSARHKNGAIFLADVHLSYVKTHSDMLVMSFVTDVTERKQAEAALQKYVREVHDLYNNAPCGYHSLDKDGVFMQVNDTELNWLGYDYHDVIGHMKFTDVLTPESIKAFHENFVVLKQRGWLKDVEYDLRCKDGSIMTILLSAIAVYDEDGQYLTNRATLYDITDMKVVQEAIRESESRYRLLAENITDMVIRLNLKAEYIYVSPSSRTVLGYEPEEMVGHSGFDFIHPDDLKMFQGAFMQAAGQRTPYEPLTARFRHKDGHYVWLEIQGRTIWSDETDEPVEFVTSSRDITVRKQAEESLLQSLAKEKELNELKSRFVSIASHEFRTPLTTILSSAEMLMRYRSRMDADHINRKLAGIAEQVQFLAKIIEDVLSLERMKTGRVEFKPADLDVNSLCRDVIENFQSHPDVTNPLHYTGSSLQANLDKRLLRQIITNLVGNAIKYSSPTRPIFINLSQENQTLILEVRDQGIGIPPKDLNHLFENFHRGSNVGTISGTGLGLPITKQAVEMHGGTIDVQSVVGEGTTITVRIPLLPNGFAAS